MLLSAPRPSTSNLGIRMASVSSSSASPFSGSADVAPGAFVAASADRDDWRAAPITPAWVREGRPVARFVPLARGRDDQGTTTLWDCTDGTFDWHFCWDETVHILEGSVVVTLPCGAVHRLTAGSVAFFPAGSAAVWKVEGYVRKLAVCRRVFPGPLARAIGLARVAKHRAATLRAEARGLLAVAAGSFAGLHRRVAVAALLSTGLGLELVFDLL